MISADEFLADLGDAGFGLYSGVPCSYLTPLIDSVIASTDIDYIGAANEGEALAIACGAQLGGLNAVTMFQNSGFGNAINPLTSLAVTFRIPVLVMTTWRGDPAGAPDEPQHELMGRVTPGIFDLLELPSEVLPGGRDALRRALDRAGASMRETGLPYGFIVRKGTFEASPTEPRPAPKRSRAQLPPPTEARPALEQDAVLSVVHGGVPERDALVATTGFTGRALYAIGDRPNQLYMVGSMGCASTLGLGLARALPARRIVVIDGDGAVLMRMGALATLGFERPPNLLHILLDNGVHDSTGSQRTVAPCVDFVSVAAACGYPRSRAVHSLDELTVELSRPGQELTFLHVQTCPRSDRKLPRPDLTPPEAARRFRAWAAGS